MAGPRAFEAHAVELHGMDEGVARSGVARRRQSALAREQLAVRRARDGAEAARAPALRRLFLELERRGRAEGRLDALAIRFAHVDDHVEIRLRRQILVGG